MLKSSLNLSKGSQKAAASPNQKWLEQAEPEAFYRGMLERHMLNQTLRIQLQTKDFLERNKTGSVQLYNTDFIGDIASLRTF